MTRLQCQQPNVVQLLGRLPGKLFACMLTLALTFAGTSTTNAQTAAPSSPTVTGADVFPGSTIAYGQVANGDLLLEKILTHPLRDRIEQLEAYQTAMASPQMIAASIFISTLESQLSDRWEAVLKNLVQHVYLGVDSKTNGAVVLFEAKDEAKLHRAATSLLAFIRNQARQNGQSVPEIKRYGETRFASINGDVVLARWRNWFVVSNKKSLAKHVVDNLQLKIDPDDQAGGDEAQANSKPEVNNALSDSAWFRKARATANSDTWAAVDLKTLRDAGLARELFAGKTDNPGAELILGGIFDGLHTAEFAALELSLDQSLTIAATLPFEAAAANDARTFFYGEEFAGRAPAPLIPKNMIANLISHRDIGGWWLSKEDLYEENVIAQLAQADSQLSTIFAGLDFGQDVLGAVKPGVQLVATSQVLPEGYDPDVKLPAFAFIGQLKEPQKVQRRFKVAFQSLIGFANINLGMQGQPQLDIETVRTGDRVVSSAEYWLEEDSDKGMFIYNFSPTIAFEGDYFIVASTKALANELAELAGNHDSDNVDTNTRIELVAQPLAESLELNRPALVANSMITEGTSKEEAETQIGILLGVINMLRKGTLDLQVKPDAIELDFNLSFDTDTKENSKR